MITALGGRLLVEVDDEDSSGLPDQTSREERLGYSSLAELVVMKTPNGLGI